MKLYIVDAFTTQRFSGNQAGVALLSIEEPEPADAFCQALAAELKHSETAFVRPTGPDSFRLRYFTPEGEVDLCGHATIAAFTTLREAESLAPGTYRASTLAGELSIQVSEQAVWMDMAPPVEGRNFSPEETAELYAAYGLSTADCPEGFAPMVVSTGLQDILLPVSTAEALDRAEQNERAVTELSERYGVVGVHMFWPCLSEEAAAHCRNFAPLYAIPEEAATGTSNGALVYYLYRHGLVELDKVYTVVQGEKMGRPSMISAQVILKDGQPFVKVGGPAVTLVRGEIEL